MPSEKGIVDPVLFSYFQYLLLTTRIPDLFNAVRGKSDFFPSSFFDKSYKVTSVEEYSSFAITLWTILFGGIDNILQDLTEYSEKPIFRYLLYSSCGAQALLNITAKQAKCSMLSNLYDCIMKIPVDYRAQEWNWIESVIFTNVIKVINSLYPLLELQFMKFFDEIL